MYQVVLFDLDGTLTDPMEGITKSVQYALDYYGIHEHDLNRLKKFIGPPLRESFMKFYGFDSEKAEEAIGKYRERFSVTGLFENSVYDGIYELLVALKCQNKILALATSKPRVFAERILLHYELMPFFDIVVGSELDGTRDRKEEVIEEVLRQIPEEMAGKIVMVGDRKHDIIGAKLNHLPSIGVRFGYAEEGELEEAGATYIVESVAALHKLLCDGK